MIQGWLGRALRSLRPAGMVLLWVACAPSPGIEAGSGGDPALHFVRMPATRVELSLSQLRRRCTEREVDVSDPYHERRMRYRALALRCVLDQGFATSGGADSIAEEGLLLRALDGYTRPVSGRQLLASGGYIAFGEVADGDVGGPRSDGDGSAFSPIDRRQVDPGPFYMIWEGVEQNDPHDHPWPYQLETIEVAPFETAFPRTVPTGLDEADAGWVGYRLFQRACASCHAINGEGGKVGPDLNIPKSIIEYRPLDQIRAYVRNPQATRYTSMPAHPGLAAADLDALIDYFVAMSQRKQDPRAGAAAPATGVDHGESSP